MRRPGFTITLTNAVAGQSFDFWYQGTMTPSDYVHTLAEDVAAALPAGASFVEVDPQRVKITLSAGSYAFTINRQARLDEATETLDKASWALGNQESTDIKIGSYGGGLKVVGGTAITNWVTDVPTGLSLSALDALKPEGSSGTTPFTFLVSRSGDVSGPTAVTYTVKGLGANAGDFAGGAFPTGTVTFAPGQVSQTLTIGVAGDPSLEGAESFSVSLSGPTNGAIVTGSTANGTIENDDTVVGIDVGGEGYEASSGSVPFVRDTAASPSQYLSGNAKVSTTASAIGATDADALYQTQRASKNFGYDVAVAAGTYEVELLLNENYWAAKGKRVFDVLLEGQEVELNLDIYARAGGKNVAYSLKEIVAVTDGQLNIRFDASGSDDRDNAAVSGIVCARSDNCSPGHLCRRPPRAVPPSIASMPPTTRESSPTWDAGEGVECVEPSASDDLLVTGGDTGAKQCDDREQWKRLDHCHL